MSRRDIAIALDESPNEGLGALLDISGKNRGTEKDAGVDYNPGKVLQDVSDTYGGKIEDLYGTAFNGSTLQDLYDDGQLEVSYMPQKQKDASVISCVMQPAYGNAPRIGGVRYLK